MLLLLFFLRGKRSPRKKSRFMVKKKKKKILINPYSSEIMNVEAFLPSGKDKNIINTMATELSHRTHHNGIMVTS